MSLTVFHRPFALTSVPGLVRALRDNSKESRSRAAYLLGQIGPVAKQQSRYVVPALIQALKDEDPTVQYQAAWALGQIGPGAKKAVPALVELLERPKTWDKADERVRGAAAFALRRIGPAAKEAVPALYQALGTVAGNAYTEIERALEALKE